MAIVAEGNRGRLYLSPNSKQSEVALSAIPSWRPDQPINRDTRDLVSGRGYGFFIWADLFTPRQLVALTTFSDLVAEAREKCYRDAIENGELGIENEERKGSLGNSSFPNSSFHIHHSQSEKLGLETGGTGAKAYSEAVAVYLAFVISRLADFNSSICGWIPVVQATRNTFGRQAIPMSWDYAEINLFGDRLANYDAALSKVLSPRANSHFLENKV